jgi:hypothetical protein
VRLSGTGQAIFIDGILSLIEVEQEAGMTWMNVDPLLLSEMQG